jgi:hypothetical protein
MNRKSFKDDLLAIAEGPIIAVQVPSEGIGYSESENDSKNTLTNLYKGKTISWELAAPLLDYPYYSGYGSMDCHDIVAWTETQVIYIHEYDGSVSFHYQLRNPPIES